MAERDESTHAPDQGNTLLPPPPPVPKWRSLIPRTPQEIAVTVCSLGTIACFFAPWFKGFEPITGATLSRYSANSSWVWAIPALSLACFFCHKHKKALNILGIGTAAVAWVGILVFLDTPAWQNTRTFGWGLTATLLLSLGLFGVSGERRFTAPIDFAVKKLGSRKADIFSHWGSIAPNVHFSTEEFCMTLEKLVQAKEWPGVEVLRVPYREAGVLSHKREYLRIIRQRQLFDVCASTFGKDYFFSLREGQIPAVVDLRAALVMILGLLLVCGTLVQALGNYGGLFATAFLLVFIIWFLFNILRMGMTKLDAGLIQLPALGAVYEAYFRPDTYFQQDTRLIFLQSVSDLVKEHIEETTSAKGLKFIDSFEKQPVLDGIYRRKRIKLPED